MTMIKIEGMHCAACERRVKRALGKERIDVRSIDHVTGKLDADLGERTTADVARAIKPLGYQVAGSASPKANARETASGNVERTILRNSAVALALSLLAQGILVLRAYPGIRGWGPQYAIPLLLLPVAIVANLTGLWHQRAYRSDVSCMTGMMAGMTIGMTTGFSIGAIAGLLNGMFWGAVIGLVTGVLAGSYAGACCGAMGVMEGIMAGFMGGTMGAMLTVMTIADHPLAMLAIIVAIAIGIIAGLARIISAEHAGRGVLVAPWSLWTVIGISIATAVLLSVTMLTLAHGLY